MPHQPYWLVRLPIIIQVLTQSDDPVLDRRAVEDLFRVGKRQALNLIHRFGGGFHCGGALQLDREGLLAQLQQLVSGNEFSVAMNRRRNLVETLRQLRQQQIKEKYLNGAVEPPQWSMLPDLPEGVDLQVGTITVQFSSSQECFERLGALLVVMDNDYDRFFRLVGCHKE